MTAEVILIVEDNDILRDGLQILLEKEGFKAVTAIHGLDALEKMRCTSPDLILSDITMPEMDGYEFYEAVRSRSESVTTPFIFLTARGERDDIFASKKLGVEDYLIKPINRQELISTLRSRLDRSQQLMLVQLEEAYQASLVMLANAIELRDKYTRGHVERVTNFSMAIARQLGWSEAQMKALQYGAILHDIGKIYVPEEILSKAGPLNTTEWDEMKHHTSLGAELLAGIPFLAMAIPIVCYHHEYWDGKGYPEGLSGEEIPITARIVAVADAFDAMTSARVYQKAISIQNALNEIHNRRGVRYDPKIVDALDAAIPKIEQFMD